MSILNDLNGKVGDKMVKRCATSISIVFIVYVSFVIFGIFNGKNPDSYIYSVYFSIMMVFLIPYSIFIILIYLMEIYNRILYIMILVIVIVCFLTIQLNDFSGYEEWQYYNREPIISYNLDYFIAKNHLELYILLMVILISYSVSIIILGYEKIKQKLRKK